MMDDRDNCDGESAAPTSANDKADSDKPCLDESILQFLDSVYDYLTLMQSLSSTLGQGWLELASARHSMGTSRVSSALFDLKSHSAATTVQLSENEDNQPEFGLNKWGAHEIGAKQLNDDERFKKLDNQLRQRGAPEAPGARCSPKGELTPVDLQVQKERSKSLSVFGALVSPKLRSAQLSFETALEALVKVANKRSSILHASDHIRKEIDCIKE